MHGHSIRLSPRAAVTLLLALPAPLFGQSPDDLAVLRKTSQAFAALAEKALPAVVAITVERTLDQQGYFYNDPHGFYGEEFLRRYYQYHGRPYQPTVEGQGSGFLISKDGYILTNNHVVGDADKIRVRTSDGQEYVAERIGADPKTEVALIRITGDNFPFLPLGNSAALRIGEWVIAIGNPFGLGETLTVGVVSATGRRMAIADYEDFIQTDAAINPGNSGGPLLNIDGEAVGINTAIFSPSGGNVGIGMAIPINLASAIKDQLVQHGRLVPGYLGLRLGQMTPDFAEHFGAATADGILVDAVESGSPAQAAGLLEGDVIMQLDGTEVRNVASFRNRIASLGPDTPVVLTVIRDGVSQSIKARTGSFPGESRALATTPKASTPPALTANDQLGLSVSDIPASMTRSRGIAPPVGIVVTQVAPGGPAAKTGIQPGDLISSINRTAITSVDDFQRFLRSAKGTKSVLLRVQRGVDAKYVVVRAD